MRCVLSTLAVALCVVPLASQPARVPVPDDEELERAESRVITVLADALLASSGEQSERAIEQLLGAASAAESPAVRYLLLQQALRGSEKAGNLAAGSRVLARIEQGFAVEAFALRMSSLRRCAQHRSVPPLALVDAYLALASVCSATVRPKSIWPKRCWRGSRPAASTSLASSCVVCSLRVWVAWESWRSP